MKTAWKIKDIIDLEYFFHKDGDSLDEAGLKALAKRDRNIYINHIQPSLDKKDKPVSRRSLIKQWLRQRRNSEKAAPGSDDAVLPGEAFDEIYKAFLYVFFIIGGLSGAGLGFSFLNYKGTEPLNVSVYLGGLVLVQIIILLFLTLFSLIRLINRSFLSRSIIWSVLSSLIIKLGIKLKARAINKLSSTQRNSIYAAIGIIKGKKKVYGSLFYWPVFILAQIFAIGFNLGLVGITLLRILGYDIAFGWQSTVQISDQAVYKIVQIIAMPWSWFVRSDIAHPSLAQIQGSHMILKDGIWHMETSDMVSWWPFLCFSVVFYGLLPRIFLLLTGIIVRCRKLSILDFNYSSCDKLIERMTTPLIKTQGLHVPDRPKEKIIQPHKFYKSDKNFEYPDTSLIALVPDDIFDQCPEKELKAFIWNTFQYQLKQIIKINEDDESDKLVLDQLANMVKESSCSNVLILQEAWQAPIKEILAFIQNLRKILGEKSKIELALIGKPKPDTIFTKVTKQDWDIWNQKIKMMGDPYLRMEKLI